MAKPKRIFIPTLILAGSLLSACSNVAYDYDQTGTLPPASRTFTFASTEIEQGAPVEPETLQEAVLRELGKDGIQQANRPDADLLVSIQFEPEKTLELEPPAAGIRSPDARDSAAAVTGEGYGPGTGSTAMSMQLSPSDTILKPAQLTIEVQDAETGETVWRASALMDLPNDTPEEERTALLDEVVTQMFEQFPAQSGTTQ